MSWQPIETAPRDGRFFIGANTEEVIVCNWPKQKNIDYAPGKWRKGQKEWNGSSIHTCSPLTHWMELPELPQQFSLKEQAKASLNRLIDLIPTEGALAMSEPIRFALEALPDD